MEFEIIQQQAGASANEVEVQQKGECQWEKLEDL